MSWFSELTLAASSGYHESLRTHGQCALCALQEIKIKPAFQPAPLDWLYQPPNGGFDSTARRYRGHRYRSRVRTLRPSRPVQLKLGPQDLLTLTNIDGATPVLLIPIDVSGNPCPEAIGLAANPGLPVSELLHNDLCLAGSGLHTVLGDVINQGGSDKANHLVAVSVFDADTAMGESFIVRATSQLSLWMLIDPTSNLAIDPLFNGGMGGAITFEHVPYETNSRLLPEPLADVRDEFSVPRGSAKAYELRAGETVQIIDVEGQQCSDFTALRCDALDRGEERYIDSTVTRSMVRAAYPVPGLFDKFYDQDMQPLLTLKQDTVGRHDTFALACTARGYEERGFFGHLNCSDNISGELSSFGVKPKSAWPAVNFFFNSWIDHSDNQLRSDEAWSQPGDYVALEAMNDLVAVSTACPDDVDPINGWNPTDVHVRIYKKTSRITHAVAYRREPDAEPIMTEHSAFHERTSALTRDYRVAKDLWLPQSYEATRLNEEYDACRNAVTIQDMSSIRKFDLLGPDAEKLLQLALSRNIGKLSVNRGIYALMCDESGSVIDDGTLFRLTDDTFRWCCGSDDSGMQFKALAEEHQLNVWVKSLFGSMANLAIQGPLSRDLLSKLCFTQPTQAALDQLKWFGSTVARLHDRDGEAFQLTRSGYTGELGYEIFCHEKSALPIWDALMESGQVFCITPMGLNALDVIRIEAGLMAMGAEFGPDIDAFEAGLGFAIDLEKEAFIGKSALARNANNPRRELKGLRFVGDEVPEQGEPVMVGRRQVGVITSACLSPALGCAIAMARIATEHSQNDLQIETGKLDSHAKRLIATVCDIPFVDPTRSRARA